MKNSILTIALVLFCGTAAFSQNAVKTVRINDLHVRDPYIVADKEAQLYYLYKSSMVEAGDLRKSGVVVYKSRDLENWEGPYTVFTTPDDNRSEEHTSELQSREK